jgi:UDP-4-amino-4,6-dideoxy-N-acetyl-beta-L-altrosamine transaminase
MKNEYQKIPYGRQSISEADIASVVEVLRSDNLTQGPAVLKFELGIAKYCNAQHAVAVNSATSALHIACLSLNLGAGDWLWTSAITFVASANCGIYCGAQVDFVDIDPNTFNLCPKALEKKLIEAKKLGKLPKLVVPVHMCGQPCDMEAIHALSIQYGFKIIEDASHAIGARYKNEPVGNCRYSDITVFSFHPVKIITTAEGGMAVTNDPNLAKSMKQFRSHGISSEEAEMDERSEDEIWNYQQLSLGFNYRMTDLQAALGLSQLKKLDEFVKARHTIAYNYNQALVDLPVKTPWQHPDSYSSFHLYPIQFEPTNCGKTQKEIYKILIRAGVFVNLHYIPVYRQPFFERLGFKKGYCFEAENYFKTSISVPIYASFNQNQQSYVVEQIRRLFQ